ncbi:MAG: hypothetical protein ACKO39_04750, partial [Chthoniobacterales bacterium]
MLLRGIGILPMISSNHGQDARATSLQNRGNHCKELRRKRSSWKQQSREGYIVTELKQIRPHWE